MSTSESVEVKIEREDIFNQLKSIFLVCSEDM